MQWACLPADLIVAVAERLSVADFARLRAVCTWWASAVKGFRPRAPSSCFPWLYPIKPTLPVDDDGRYRLLDVVPEGLSFFNMPENRCYRLPGLAGGISVNLHHRDGWYVFLPDDDRHHLLPVLVNPLSRTRLPLPSIRTLPRYRKSNVRYTFIPCPAAHNNITFVLYGYPLDLPWIPFAAFLAFARPGDDSWTCVSDTWLPVRRFADVAYHRGKFYALCFSGELLAFDIGSTPRHPTKWILARNKYNHVPDPFSRDWPSRVMSLATSPSGDLLHVRPRGGGVKNFVVMKLDENLDGWVEIRDLGGSCMLVDESQAMLISLQQQELDVPAWARRNKIYFAGSAVRNSIHLPASYHDYNDEGNCLADVQIFEVGNVMAQSTRLSIPENFRSHRCLFWFRPSFI